jgi:hypothetical protein
MTEYHDRLDEPHQGEDRPVAGWPGHNPGEHADDHTDDHTDEHTDEHDHATDEHTGEQTDEHTDGGLTDDRTEDHTDDHTDETRDEDEPLVGEVWNDDAKETDGEHDRPADVTEAERTEDTHRDHVAEPFGTEEPMIVDEPAAEESDGLAAEPAGVAVADRPETTGETDPDVEPVAVAEPTATEPVTEPATETAAEPQAEAATGSRPTAADDFNVEQLIEPEAAERLRERWRDVKTVFVDDPADAVRQAGALTGEAVDELTAALGRLREKLDGHTGEGGEADTEKLRVALRGYGSLIEHILTR